MLVDLFENRLALALIVVLGVPAVLVLYIVAVEALLTRVSRRVSAAVRPWLWLAPALGFLGVFLVYPTLATIYRSFQNRRGDAFSGLENYVWFFTRSDTLIALRNNVLWVLLLPLLVVALGLGIAVLVDRVRYEVVVKSVVFLPMAISFVAAGVIWRLMYDLNPNTGTLNAALDLVNGPRVAWLSTSPINNLMLILVGVWMFTGLAMVILSAGLKGISAELLEAARIDGANEREVFRFVILPLLAPTIAVVATTVIIFALKTFDIVYVMTNGNFETDVIANTMYKELFANGQQGRAAAVAVVLLLATVPVMILNVKRFKQQEEVR
ncbi:carbohydrate ABC transporter permease [Occultella gossypii]|uniref:Sugar ABC transporter permease n=1 Tax=Occultella gossypii TaxID=2800820 RepID=A0ABS7S7K6_9MICO|nr:sugar ABC transporter permease [Occultella gossypii]MBZ2196341.1 sugar ABC transporter permease [Occultella gossypii]